MRHTLLFIAIIVLSCKSSLRNPFISNQNDTIANNDKLKEIGASKIDTLENIDYQTIPFFLAKAFPIITDTVSFIKALKENCHLFDRPTAVETINYFKKIKIYGSEKQYYLLEYDYHDGATCAFPWKKQILFDTLGKLIKIISAIRIDVVKIFPKENPFLFCVSSTGHGNGWHDVLHIKNDTIDKVYDGFLSTYLRTYDRHQDNTVNEPNEFHYKIADVNNDSYNDIIFFGKVVLIQGKTKSGIWYDSETINGKIVSYSAAHPFKKIPATLNFLYNPKQKKFIEQEDYAKKYEYIFGTAQ